MCECVCVCCSVGAGPCHRSELCVCVCCDQLLYIYNSTVQAEHALFTRVAQVCVCVFSAGSSDKQSVDEAACVKVQRWI